MTTSTLLTAPAPAPAIPVTGTFVSDRTAVLALVAPLLLFAHGILEWVDGLGRPDDLGDLAPSGTSPLGVAAGAVLVAAIGLFCWLTTSLGARLQHLPLALPAGGLAAFGAGAAGTVWLGRTVGLLDASLPTTLTSGGPVLAGVALSLVLGALTLEGRMPAGSLALTGAAAATLLLPWGLEPLAALLLLIALAPLTRSPEPA